MYGALRMGTMVGRPELYANALELYVNVFVAVRVRRGVEITE